MKKMAQPNLFILVVILVALGLWGGAHEFINEQYAPEDDEVGQV